MGIREIVAENVRAYRKLARLTQEELAGKCGVHRTYIGSIEQRRSNPSLRSVEKIATALDIEPALLFVHRHIGKIIETYEYAVGRLPGASDDTGLSVGDFALCEFSEREVRLRPITVYDEDVSVSLLCALIEEGHAANLEEAYSDRIDLVMGAIEFRKRRLAERRLRNFVDGMDKC